MDLSFNYTFEWEGIIGACKTFQHLRRMESTHIISASYIHCLWAIWLLPLSSKHACYLPVHQYFEVHLGKIFEFFAHRCKFYLLFEQGWTQQIHFYWLHCIIISLTVLSIHTVFKITPQGIHNTPHIHHDIPMVLNVHSTGCGAAQPKNIIIWPHLKSDLCNLSQFQLNTSPLPPPPPPPKKKKIFPNSRKVLLQLAKKILKKLRKLQDSTNFSLGELYKTFIFQTEWSKTSWKPLNTPALILN